MRLLILLVSGLGLIAGFPTSGAAAIYKWVAENGTVTYRDTPPPSGTQVTVIEPRNPAIEVNKPGPSVGGVLESVQEKAEAAIGVVGEALGGGSSASALPSLVTAQKQEASLPVVELYVTSWCGYCKRARAFLQARGVVFREYDIEQDPAAARRMAAINPRGGVPVAVIDGQTLIGFHQPSYERALGL